MDRKDRYREFILDFIFFHCNIVQRGHNPPTTPSIISNIFRYNFGTVEVYFSYIDRAIPAHEWCIFMWLPMGIPSGKPSPKG